MNSEQQSRILHLVGEIEPIMITNLINNIIYLNSEDKIKPIELHVNSFGGSLEDGFALINIIKTSSAPIVAFVSNAQSMATTIALACDMVITYPYTIFMVHELAYEVNGKLIAHKEELKHSINLQNIMDKIILENSEIKPKDLQEHYDSGKNWFIMGNEIKELGMTNTILPYNAHRDTTFKSTETQ